jgi:hypothetical protein
MGILVSSHGMPVDSKETFQGEQRRGISQIRREVISFQQHSVRRGVEHMGTGVPLAIGSARLAVLTEAAADPLRITT